MSWPAAPSSFRSFRLRLHLTIGVILTSLSIVPFGVTPVRAGGNLEAAVNNQIINISWSPMALPIGWKMNQLGLTNNCDQGNPTCVGGVSPMTLQRTIDAFTTAFNAWQAVPTSRIAFAFTGTTAVATTGVDGINLVTFSDSSRCSTAGVVASTPNFSLAAPLTVGPSNRDVNGDGTIDLDPAIYPDGTFLPAGTIIDADTAFCPNSFDFTDFPIDSPVSLGDVLDVVAVATHELGHFHGLSHASLSTPLPTMFPFVDFTAAWGADASVLAQDDIAATSRYYPDPSFSATFGSITGRAFFPDGTTPADGISLSAYNKQTGEMTVQVYSVSRFTSSSDLPGSFRIDGLPPGTYLVAAEYFDGASTGGQTSTDDTWWDNNRYNLTIFNSNVTGTNVNPPETVRPEFLSNPETSNDDLAPPVAVVVGAGQTVSVPSILINTDPPAAPAGATALNLANAAYVQVVFPTGFSFPFYGQSYPQAFVGDNGYLTFGSPGQTTGDTRGFLGSASAVAPPGIAPGLADLDPGVDNSGKRGGPLDVFAQFVADPIAGDRVEITYLGIPLASTDKSCTAVVRLFRSGRVEIQYRFWGSWWGLAGISPGGNGSEPAVAIDVSRQLPFSGPTGAALYEHFGFAQRSALGGDDTFAPAFDLGGSLLIFAPNAAGGYDLTSPDFAIRPPGEIQNQIFTSATTLAWDAPSDATSFNVYRGDLGTFVDTNADGAAESYGLCLDHGLPSATDADGSMPGIGAGYFYLVTGKNGGGESTLGQASSGATRPNAQPCP